MISTKKLRISMIYTILIKKKKRAMHCKGRKFSILLYYGLSKCHCRYKVKENVESFVLYKIRVQYLCLACFYKGMILDADFSASHTGQFFSGKISVISGM